MSYVKKYTILIIDLNNLVAAVYDLDFVGFTYVCLKDT